MVIILAREAIKQYGKLRKSDQSKVNKKLLKLKDNPMIGKKLSGDLEGKRSLKTWPYRIIYFIKEDKQEVWITSILHRQRAYK